MEKGLWRYRNMLLMSKNTFEIKIKNCRKLGILFESYLKNFDEELSVRRGGTNYWSEEELFNTF